MVLKSSIVFEPDTSIEVFFDNIIEVGTTQTRELMNYDSSTIPEIKTYARNRQPSNTAYQGSIQTDIIEKKRTLVYLNAYADKVIVIDGGNDNAIYGNINPLNISDRNKEVADLSFTAIAKGGITGQFYDSDDCTSTGTRTADSDAVNGYADVLDANGEDIFASLTQSVVVLPEGDYMMFIRAKDTNTVASDLGMEIYNDTDSTSLAYEAKTLTTSYAYYTLDFTVESDDLGDLILFDVQKITAAANSISIDFIGFVKV